MTLFDYNELILSKKEMESVHISQEGFMKKLYFFFFVLFIFQEVSAQNFTSIASGNWDANTGGLLYTTWNENGIAATRMPGSNTGDYVTIDAAHTVIIDVTPANALTSITVNGILRFGAAGTGRTLTTTGSSGSVTIGSGGTIDVYADGGVNTTHTMSISGSIINNGTFDCAPAVNRYINVTFTISGGSQSVSGTPTSMKFNNITLSGAANVDRLDISLAYTLNGLVTINTGTFKHSSSSTITPFSASPTLGTNQGLWCNGGVVNIAGSFTVNSTGNLLVQSGTLNVGTTISDILSISGQNTSVSISGGNLVIGGRWEQSGGNSTNTMNITGGTIVVSNAGQINDAKAVFQVPSTNNFTMSDGTVKIMHANLGSGGDLAITNDSVSITSNSTFLIGSGSSTTGNIKINSAAFLRNLTIDAGSTSPYFAGPTVVNGTLTLTSGTLTTGSNLTMGNSATISRSSGSISDAPTFNTSANVEYTGSSLITTGVELPTVSTVLNNLTVNNSGGVTLNAGATVNGTLTLTSGAFNNSSQTLTLGNSAAISRATGSLSAAPTFGTSVDVTYTGSSGVTTGNELPTSSSVLNNLTVNNSGGVTLNAGSTVNGTPTLASGTFTVGAYTLSLNGPAIAGTASNLSTTSSSSLSFGGSTAGINIPGSVLALSNLTINNANGVSLNSSPTIDGTLALTNGALSIGGNTLTLNGAITKASGGSLTGGGSSNITFGGVGASTDLPAVTLNNLIINRSNGIALGGDVTVGSTLTLTDGTFSVGSNSLSLNGPAIAGTAANLSTTSSSNLSCGGSSSSVSIPSSVLALSNLTINNANGVSLNSSPTVNGIFTLTNGNLATGGSNTLALSSGGSVSRASGHVIGNFKKNVAAGATSKTFEVGTANGYSPVTVAFGDVSVAGDLTAVATQTTHTNAVTPNETLTRYWSFTNSGITFDNYSATFSYLAADFNGVQFIELTDEGAMVVGKYASSAWTFPTIGTRTPGGTDDGGSIEVTGVTSFSDFAIGKNESALPVELTSFTALVQNKSVNLNWQTATEVSNYGFEIQRQKSEIGNQKSEWEKIGFVQGHGNSNSQKEYLFEDKNPQVGKLQYRLKQIDNDGAFEYSNTVEVNFDAPVNFVLEQNFPNPFNPETVISYQLPVSGFVVLKVYDLLGREVATLVNKEEEAGIHHATFSLATSGTPHATLASGIYLYRIEANAAAGQAGRFVESKKMILMK